MQNAELYYIVGADSISARFCFGTFRHQLRKVPKGSFCFFLFLFVISNEKEPKGATKEEGVFLLRYFPSLATESNQRMPPKRRGFKNCGFKTVFVKKLKFNIKIENSFKTLFFHILSPLETPLPDNVYRTWCIFRINVAE